VRIYEVAPGQSRARWLYNVGLYQIDAGQPALAMRSFRESIALESKDPAPHLALVMLLAAQGDKAALETGVRAMESALGAGAGELLGNAARQLREVGQSKEAELISGVLGGPR
jgi:Tfp pilus assembly protein PilF